MAEMGEIPRARRVSKQTKTHTHTRRRFHFLMLNVGLVGACSDIAAARAVFELAVERCVPPPPPPPPPCRVGPTAGRLGDDANNEEFFVAFAKFEERNKEVRTHTHTHTHTPASQS